MKRLISFLLLITLCATTLFSQTNIPQLVSFSAVVRDANNNPLVNTAVSVRLTFKEGGQNGDKVYCALQQTTTNQNGFMSVQLNREVLGIGCNGAPSNSFEEIQWENGGYWMEVEYQTVPGSPFVNLGELELASSFYAFAAKTAESIKNVELSGANNGDVLSYNSATNQWEPTVISGGGGGDYQNLSVSFSDDTLYLSNGNWVIIPGISEPNRPVFHPGLPITNIISIILNTAVTAIANVEIEFDGASEISQMGVCWSTNSEPTLDDDFTTEQIDSNTNSFSSLITGLEINTTYYIRPYAINSSGIGYGNTQIYNTVTYAIPNTYDFTDADGNNTVSYTGQTDRMNMLGELINHMKTENWDEAGANNLDEVLMHNMYANENSPFTGAGVGASGKDLESKTAGSSTIQQQFKTWMSEAAAASTQATTGYFQSNEGYEWTQLVEKGLMTACFAYQITDNYLTDAKIGSNVENITPDDGDVYTAMEHHWDEGYGYFADNNDYAQATSRYWVKYANKSYMNGLGDEIATAFRTGRAAINASRLAGGDGLRFHADVLAQRDIVVSKVYRMAAGMAIHYLYDTKNSVASQESQNDINHSLSEAYAFTYGLKVLNGGA